MLYDLWYRFKDLQKSAEQYGIYLGYTWLFT